MEKAEKNCDSSPGGSGLLFLVAGLGVGCGLTVLFAPHSAAALRRFIRGRADAARGRIRERAAAAQDFKSGSGGELAAQPSSGGGR